MIVDEFDIYATDRGLRPVASPIKRGILHLLGREELTQKEIAVAIDRAQATTARHLLELEAANLISSALDPDDSRRKLYTLEARPAATSAQPLEGLKPFLEKIIQQGLQGQSSLLEAINHSVRFTIETWGLTFDALMRETGQTIGRQFAATLPPTPDLEALTQALAAFWSGQELGEVKILSLDPLDLVVEGCYGCGGAPDVGRTLCALDEGILEAILTHQLGGSWQARETECHGTGHHHCRFKIDRLDTEAPEPQS